MSSPKESPEQLRARLADLTAHAAAKDAVKDFNAAAELYSQATELQAELNGEMSVDNADLLYAYGRSLYNVAVSKSDVLGSKIPGDQALAENATSSGSTSTNEGLIKNAIASSASKSAFETTEQVQTKSQINQQYFQFTGDENFDDSDSEEGEDEADKEEDDDDFANAFEVLDLARVLLLKKLDGMENKKDEKGKLAEMPPDIRHIKERLADIYDLQAEISLEGERFTDAVTDLRTALELKEALFPLEDPSVAECHYKLSLALEFASVTKQEDGGEPSKAGKTARVDTAMRDEAAKHMEIAIESCKIRMTQEEQKLNNGEITEEDKVNAARRKIANVKEIVADMEQRLVDLRQPLVSINDPSQNADNTVNGILGQIMGKTPEEQNARLDEVAKNANDLSALVRKKAPSDPAHRKRPHESSEQGKSVKRARAEDAS